LAPRSHVIVSGVAAVFVTQAASRNKHGSNSTR
jgi:hypothetical protein